MHLKSYLYGAVSSVLTLAVIFALLFNFHQPMPKKVRKAKDIQINSYRLPGDLIMLFVREYFPKNKDDQIQPSLLIMSKDMSEFYKQVIPKDIVNSCRMVLAYSDENEKLLLFSPDEKGWVEWNNKERRFKYHADKDHPACENCIIVLESSLADKKCMK